MSFLDHDLLEKEVEKHIVDYYFNLFFHIIIYVYIHQYIQYIDVIRNLKLLHLQILLVRFVQFPESCLWLGTGQ